VFPPQRPRLPEAARSAARHPVSLVIHALQHPFPSPPSGFPPGVGTGTCQRLRPLPGNWGCSPRAAQAGKSPRKPLCHVPCCRHLLRRAKEPVSRVGPAVSPHSRAHFLQQLRTRLTHRALEYVVVPRHPSSRALRIREAPGWVAGKLQKPTARGEARHGPWYQPSRNMHFTLTLTWANKVTLAGAFPSRCLGLSSCDPNRKLSPLHPQAPRGRWRENPPLPGSLAPRGLWPSFVWRGRGKGGACGTSAEGWLVVPARRGRGAQTLGSLFLPGSTDAFALVTRKPWRKSSCTLPPPEQPARLPILLNSF
jgi:hypothetical protein